MPVFRSRFDGTCQTCGKRVTKGQYITWNRSEKGVVRHIDCANPDADHSGAMATKVDDKLGEMQAKLDQYAEQLAVLSAKASGAPASVADLKLPPSAKDHDAMLETAKKVLAAKIAAAKKAKGTANWWELLETITLWANKEKQYVRVLLIGPPGTGKSTTCLKLAGIKPDNRITFTRGMGVEDAIGMYQLIKGETVFVPTKISAAMEKGEPMLWDEVDHHAEEISSGMYGWIDDSPHVTLPTGDTKEAQPGYAVFATTNSSVTALPDAILDRFDVVLPAIMPHPEAVKQFKTAARREAVNNHFRTIDQTPWKWSGKPTLRRMRAFEMLEPLVGEDNASRLAFGEAGKEVLGVITTADRSGAPSSL